MNYSPETEVWVALIVGLFMLAVNLVKVYAPRRSRNLRALADVLIIAAVFFLMGMVW
jgi:uncharacterized membrane protein